MFKKACDLSMALLRVIASVIFFTVSGSLGDCPDCVGGGGGVLVVPKKLDMGMESFRAD